jgi:ornithine cyclodeaminase/alanine dehydrogenase-like protein (mu-crystallin family)
MRILSAADVQASVTMAAAIQLMRDAFAQLSEGTADVPDRVALRVPDRNAAVLVMPAYLRATGQLGLKVVGVFPENAERGMPTVPATVLLLDAHTGLPCALMDGTYLTALRTGAATGLATDLLARPDAHVATLFGAGGQAPFQLAAICQVRAITRAWIVNRTRAHAERLAAQIAGWPDAWRPREVRLAEPGHGAHEAVTEADVIATATSASEPLFRGDWVRSGTHVDAIGAFTPTARELDGALMGRALIVVDARTTEVAAVGDLALAAREGAIGANASYTELGEVVLGARPGRTDPEQITCFKSVGNAAQDIVVADYAYREALRLGLGLEVELS